MKKFAAITNVLTLILKYGAFLVILIETVEFVKSKVEALETQKNSNEQPN